MARLNQAQKKLKECDNDNENNDISTKVANTIQAHQATESILLSKSVPETEKTSLPFLNCAPPLTRARGL